MRSNFSACNDGKRSLLRKLNRDGNKLIDIERGGDDCISMFRFFFSNSLYLSLDFIRSDIDEYHRKEKSIHMNMQIKRQKKRIVCMF